MKKTILTLTLGTLLFVCSSALATDDFADKNLTSKEKKQVWRDSLYGMREPRPPLRHRMDKIYPPIVLSEGKMVIYPIRIGLLNLLCEIYRGKKTCDYREIKTIEKITIYVKTQEGYWRRYKSLQLNDPEIRNFPGLYQKVIEETGGFSVDPSEMPRF